MKVERLVGKPIVEPGMDERMGSNINGPSLIRVPDWIADPLGNYYLYFAHHQGDYIRLAYADDIEGPWKVYTPGTLQLMESGFVKHIASPDIHIDSEHNLIRMYYHGSEDLYGKATGQVTRLAVSRNGLDFRAFYEILGNSYMRIFRWGDYHYSLEMSGRIRRSPDGFSNFDKGPKILTDHLQPNSPYLRHCAVKVVDSLLYIFFTRKEDKPERILMTTVDLSCNWMDWNEGEVKTILFPDMDYEGGDLPLRASEGGSVHKPVRQLRDPAVFEEEGKTFLLYAVAGERGIALAEISGF